MLEARGGGISLFVPLGVGEKGFSLTEAMKNESWEEKNIKSGNPKVSHTRVKTWLQSQRWGRLWREGSNKGTS